MTQLALAPDFGFMASIIFFTIVSLGLFYFVITGFCLWLTARLVDGFVVHGVFMTIVASILISLISTLISRLLRS